MMNVRSAMLVNRNVATPMEHTYVRVTMDSGCLRIRKAAKVKTEMILVLYSLVNHVYYRY